jgi:hypothetical protein
MRFYLPVIRSIDRLKDRTSRNGLLRPINRGGQAVSILAMIKWAGTIISIAAIGRFHSCGSSRNPRQTRGIRFAPAPVRSDGAQLPIGEMINRRNNQCDICC